MPIDLLNAKAIQQGSPTFLGYGAKFTINQTFSWKSCHDGSTLLSQISLGIPNQQEHASYGSGNKVFIIFKKRHGCHYFLNKMSKIEANIYILKIYAAWTKRKVVQNSGKHISTLLAPSQLDSNQLTAQWQNNAERTANKAKTKSNFNVPRAHCSKRIQLLTFRSVLSYNCWGLNQVVAMAINRPCK